MPAIEVVGPHGREQPITPEQIESFMQAIDERIIDVPLRVPQNAQTADEGIAWSAFSTLRGVAVAYKQHVILGSDPYTEYAFLTFGPQQSAPDTKPTLQERAYKVLLKDTDHLPPKAYPLYTEKLPSRQPLQFHGQAFDSYPQIAPIVLSQLRQTQELKPTSYVDTRIASIRKDLAHASNLLNAGFSMHGLGAARAEKAIHTLRLLDPLEDFRPLDTRAAEISDGDISVLMTLLKKYTPVDARTCKDHRNRDVTTFERYDPELEYDATISYTESSAGIHSAAITLSHSVNTWEKLSIYAAGKYARGANYDFDGESSSIPITTHVFDAWIAKVTNTPVPAPIRTVTCEHLSFFTDLLIRSEPQYSQRPAK